MYWLPYSSHTSHHPSQTPCLPWTSYATQKLMLDSCKMLQRQSEAFHTFLWHFFQVWNRNLLHIVLLKCPDVQIAFLKFTSNDNQVLVGFIPISAVTVHSNKILNFQESTTILNICTKKSGNLLKAPRTCWCINLFVFALLCRECSFVSVVYIVCLSIINHNKFWEQHI